MIQSGAVLPDPLPLPLSSPLPTASLLVTETIFQPATQHASFTTATMLMGTILWLGGHNLAGQPVTLVITGGMVSCTMIVLSQDVWLPSLSAAVTATILVPSFSFAGKTTATMFVVPLCGTWFVCTFTPFTIQATVRASPLALDTWAV